MNSQAETLRMPEEKGIERQLKRQKYLVFTLKDENYGIPLSSVKEVIGVKTITPIPQVPAFFKGLINLRGMIISVLDLRLKLALQSIEYVPEKTCIIIAEISELTLGVIVDEVREVASFSDEQVDSKQHASTEINRELITGFARTDSEKLTILLDIQAILSSKDLEILRTVQKRSHSL